MSERIQKRNLQMNWGLERTLYFDLSKPYSRIRAEAERRFFVAMPKHPSRDGRQPECQRWEDAQGCWQSALRDTSPVSRQQRVTGEVPPPALSQKGWEMSSSRCFNW